jgi:FeS assembly SUF system protein
MLNQTKQARLHTDADLPQQSDIRGKVIAALKTVYDPEIPLNLYDLGLIYAIDIDMNQDVAITMTLTTPHCPVAEAMPAQVEKAVQQLAGVEKVKVNLVWDPPWDQSRLSDEAKLSLGWY